MNKYDVAVIEVAKKLLGENINEDELMIFTDIRNDDDLEMFLACVDKYGVEKNKEVDTIAELNDRLLEIKEAGLYAENITIKCKAVLFDDKKRLMLYDEVEAIAFHIDKETVLPKIAENTQNVLNIGFYINADTKKEEILFLKVIKSEA